MLFKTFNGRVRCSHVRRLAQPRSSNYQDGVKPGEVRGVGKNLEKSGGLLVDGVYPSVEEDINMTQEHTLFQRA